jgi:serine/threonine protein kinase
MYIGQTLNTEKNLGKVFQKEENEDSLMKLNKEQYINNQKEKIKTRDDYDSTDLLLDQKKVNVLIKKYNQKFGETFELLDSIKAGSSGAVHRARVKKNINRIVAVKVLNEVIKDKTENKIVKSNREIMIHKNLFHKNIPKVFGYYPLGPLNSCIVMEYNKYSDIDNFKKTVIKRQVLSDTLICYLAGGIAEALLYLATKKIIHMDVKLQNVLIDDFLNIRLTDYSISLKYNTNKEKIQLKQEGTCYYMSPEVIEKKSIDVCDASKIDVYSFGVLLYFLAFHQYPYQLDKIDSKNYSGILKNIKEEELVFPEGTGHSKLFKNFVAKCLEKDIKKRYNIYQVMNDPWIKGYQVIQDEKDNLVNAEKFLVELMVDSIKKFNDYIKEKENES